MDQTDKMVKLHRHERMAALTHTFVQNPGKQFTLTAFGERFGAAKSTMSEDIALLQKTFQRMDIGLLETTSGAAGGVCFYPNISRASACAWVQFLCKEIAASDRLLPGGYYYLTDILTRPDTVRQMGIILAGEYQKNRPDFVLTVETKGIPVALMTAEALGVPLMIARRTSSLFDGSAVNINYVTSSGIATMSLGRRAVQAGQRALIVDDVLKAGGTAKGMMDLMAEFSVEVIGSAFVISRAISGERLITGEKSLMVMRGGEGEALSLEPAEWLREE